jgi:divalent metal cation (Fe/Co/Zn/Cd) transporter
MGTHAAAGALELHPSPAATRDEDRRLHRIMVWGYATLFPMMALFIVVALATDSSAVLVYAVNFGITIAVQGFSIYAIRQVMRADAFRFPYGAGKLENFAAFLGGVLNIPSGVYLAVIAVTHLLHPDEVSYALALVPIAAETGRMAVLYLSVRRLARRVDPPPPPLLQAYLLDWRVNLLSDCGVLVAFAAGGLLVRGGLAGAGERMDSVIALAISVYMLWVGVVLVRRNFSALMDLPLPEGDQLKIMKVLADHFADYGEIGNISTRSSGKTRFVEMELGFPADRSLGEITALSREMEAALATVLPDLVFRIVPTAGV